MFWLTKSTGYVKALGPRSTAFQQTKTRFLIRLSKLRITSLIPNSFMWWLRRTSGKTSKLLSRLQTSGVEGFRHSECCLRNSLWFSTQWIYFKKHTTSWWARYGYRSRKLDCCTKSSLPLFRWDKCSPRPNTLLTFRQIPSLLLSNKSSTLTVFLDINK